LVEEAVSRDRAGRGDCGGSGEHVEEMVEEVVWKGIEQVQEMVEEVVWKGVEGKIV
jgi:hypothetical protein